MRCIVGVLIGWWVGLVTTHCIKVFKGTKLYIVMRLVVVEEEEERL